MKNTTNPWDILLDQQGTDDDNKLWIQASLRDAGDLVWVSHRGLKPHGYHQTSLRDEYVYSTQKSEEPAKTV